MTRRLVLAVLTGLLAGLIGAGAAAALEVGDRAPEFTLVAPGGKQVKLKLVEAAPIPSGVIYMRYVPDRPA